MRLSDCWRVVAESMRTAGECVPQAATGYDATWTSEVDWLLTTMDWWGEDAWCLEWVTTEVEAIRGKLLHSIESRIDPHECPTCGRRADAYTSDALMVAECDACQRVIGMWPRRLLTTRQAAEHLGVTDRAIRKRVQAGQIPATTSPTGGYLMTEDDLDAVRRKLGIPTRGANAC